MIVNPLHRDLLAEVDAGNVSRRERGPLAIYNYTANCNFSRNWTPTTMAARGLILEEATSRVVARPFKKFFNMGETPETSADVLPWDKPFEVTEKLDGSLGIVFFYRGRWDIATRGAFESEQAVYAREKLLPLYEWEKMGPSRNLTTYLVEIIYPGNRVVIDYHGRDELVILAAIDRTNGKQFSSLEIRSRAVLAGIPVARRRPLPWRTTSGKTSTDPTDLSHDPNTEGYVLYWPSCDLRIKIKAPDYVAAHRCLDLVSPRRVLELIVEGRDDDVAAQLPNHVWPTFEAIRADIDDRTGRLLWDSGQAFDAHQHLLANGGRKDFALAVSDQPNELKPLIFKRADGKDADTLLVLARNLVAKQLRDNT